MAITPKDILGAALGVGRFAVSTGIGIARRLLGDQERADTTEPPQTPATPAAETTPATASRPTPARTRRTTSGSPRTVGAPKAGQAGAPRSSTSSARRKTGTGKTTRRTDS